MSPKKKKKDDKSEGLKKPDSVVKDLDVPEDDADEVRGGFKYDKLK